ncbi:hypothetical protein SJAV_02500 [Sulfurisphaera javensis]|uniref:Sulfocyanin n=1 Tax=Sulfurisphaera javensis TaxID=2049879 RepID=A0AAT9GNC1_9CREN
MKSVLLISIILLLASVISFVAFTIHSQFNKTQQYSEVNSPSNVSYNSTSPKSNIRSIIISPLPIVPVYNNSMKQGIYLYDGTIYIVLNITVNSIKIMNQTYIRPIGMSASPVSIGIQAYGIINTTLYNEIQGLKEVNVSIYDGKQWINLVLPVFETNHYIAVLCYLEPPNEIQPY